MMPLRCICVRASAHSPLTLQTFNSCGNPEQLEDDYFWHCTYDHIDLLITLIQLTSRTGHRGGATTFQQLCEDVLRLSGGLR